MPANVLYDVEINGLGLMLTRPPGKDARRPLGNAKIQGEYGPATSGGGLPGEEVAIAYDTWDGGSGYGRNGPKGTYGYGTFLTTRSGGVAMPAGALNDISSTVPWSANGYGVSAVEFQGGLYFSTNGPTVFKINYSTLFPETSGTFANGLGETDNLVVFQGNLYLSLTGTNVAGTGQSCTLQRFDGTTWISYYDIPRRKLATIYWVVKGVGGYRLVATDSTNGYERHTTADPGVAANWTSPVAIGDATEPVVSLATGNRVVYFVKASGVYSMDSRGYSPNLTPGWRAAYHPGSGVAATIYEGRVVASHYEGIDMIDVVSGEREDVPRWVDPAHALPDAGPVHGTPTAYANERGWLCVAFYNLSQNRSYIAYAIPRDRVGVSGPGPFVWHFSEADVPGRVTLLKVSSPQGSPRLWIWTVDGSTPGLYWQWLPRAANAYQDYLEGGPMQFSTAASLYQGREAWGRAGVSKTLRRFAIVAEDLGGARSISVLASPEGGAYVNQGTAQESPRVSFRPSSELTSGYEVQLRADLAGTPTDPPILRSLEAYAELNPEQTEIKQYDVSIGRSIRRLNGSADERDVGAVLAQLQALQDSPPVSMTDELGRTLTVKVRGGLRTQTVEDPDEAPGKSWTVHASFSVAILERPAYYDVGATYDAGVVYV